MAEFLMFWFVWMPLGLMAIAVVVAAACAAIEGISGQESTNEE